MADAAISVFLGLALDVVRSNVDLISGVKGDFDVICDDLARMKGFLVDAAHPECRELASIKILVSQIRDVAYDAEDAVEQYVMYQYGGVFKKLVDFKDIQTIAEEFKNIRGRIQRIKEDRLFYDIYNLRRRDNQTTLGSQPKGVVQFAKGDEVVGLEEETKELIRLLTSDSSGRKVVLLAGMPGLGKTTLANKVYTDVKSIDYKFLYIVWVRVPELYDTGDVLRQIWRAVGDRSLGDPKNIPANITADELAEHLHQHLEKKHCLIILDNVWSAEAWSQLQNALPRHNKNLRILITSRVSTVAPEAIQFPLEPLSADKGFELLEKRAFRTQKCPVHLREAAEKIVSKCGGLPLAIVIIAGVLQQLPHERSCWDDVSNRVTENVAKEDNCWEIVRLSYDNLPHHLRPCFLYFGIFPQSAPISVSRLFCLWIAEGFIKAEPGSDLEELADKYLQDLVSRNLVMIEESKCNNKIKRCRVHDVLHVLCIKEATEEKMFYQIQDLDHYLGEANQQTNKHRRVSIHETIHSHVLDYLPKAKASGPLVRSFLSLGPDLSLPVSAKKTFPGPFQLLKVLDVTSILLPRLPDLLAKLLHLRYLAIYISFNTISSDITKLTKLQVLIVKVKEGENIYDLKIAANIWKMYQLRHLQTNIPAYFSLPPKKLEQANKSSVRTVMFLAPETCTLELFSKIDKVKKLGIRGDLQKLPMVDRRGEDGFVGFSPLKQVEVLKIKNETESCAGKVSFFPGKKTFPNTIRQLTLSKTYLSWETHMNGVVAKLPNLVVLKLKDEAFVGKYWKPPSEGFHNLEVFLLGKTDLVEWDASSDHFPMLSSIFLRFCDRLKTIPSDFCRLQNLQKIDLYSTNRAVASSARIIKDKRQMENPHIMFKLSVFPSDH